MITDEVEIIKFLKTRAWIHFVNEDEKIVTVCSNINAMRIANKNPQLKRLVKKFDWKTDLDKKSTEKT